MRWTRALTYVAVAAVLATIYIVTAPPPPPSPASPAAARARRPPAIDSLRLEAGGRTVRATRSGASGKSSNRRAPRCRRT
jgi:hypothetical protein